MREFTNDELIVLRSVKRDFSGVGNIIARARYAFPDDRDLERVKRIQELLEEFCEAGVIEKGFNRYLQYRMNPDILSPTPWKLEEKDGHLYIIDARGEEVCHDEDCYSKAPKRADMEMIVTAVNQLVAGRGSTK